MSLLPQTHRLLIVAAVAFASIATSYSQTAGILQGRVLDPSGALVPHASVSLAHSGKNLLIHSDSSGFYRFAGLVSGSYVVHVEANNFAPKIMELSVEAGKVSTLDIVLKIGEDKQFVRVPSDTNSVTLSPDQNANAIILRDSDLDALADDPDQLQRELQALSGPTAGPDGGQIYIDGFTGGQLPPKSSIREIRINQNPFSAEFDRLGYGRIEILTKPGTDKLSGYIMAFGELSQLNTANPFLKQQPQYYGYSLPTYISGPLTKTASGFLSVFHNSAENQSVVNAIDPANITELLQTAVSSPASIWNLAPRLDMQIGQNNTLTIRDNFMKSQSQNNGIGALNLPSQGYAINRLENTLQVGNTTILSPRWIDETHFQWRRIRNAFNSNTRTPAIIVQGAFTTGGNSLGTIQDHQDLFELQDLFTTSSPKHTIRFGIRLRLYHDSNYSTAGSNGTYIFQSIANYQAQRPDLYQTTIIHNPVVRVLLFDGSLFYQDDVTLKRNRVLSYGLRYETQNHISDHTNLAPRIGFAWGLGANRSQPSTVLRIGYGWFYNRFTVPESSISATGTPYLTQVIHQNGINQQTWSIDQPKFYDPTTPVDPTTLNSPTSIPIVRTIDPHFHAALNIQSGIGLDHQLSRASTLNITYLFTQGTHQYQTNNITAPQFDSLSYSVSGARPATYNYQYQSGGKYQQHQLIVTGNIAIHTLAIHSTYAFSQAKSDTAGIDSFPSVASDPQLDYGRPPFATHHRLTLLATYAAPHKIIISPMLIAQSGTPYNITIGSDLTGNNQFNARPTYGTCGTSGVVATPYGCLDTTPTGRYERIIPYGLGTGPTNFVLNMRLSKAIGIGPRVQIAHGLNVGGGGFSTEGSGLSGSRGSAKTTSDIRRRYTLTLVANAYNVFNIVNRGTPNGVLSSPLFGTSQTLATGFFQPFSAGNRTILLQTAFNF